MEENLKDYWKNDKRILKAEQEATRDKELYEKAINNQRKQKTKTTVQNKINISRNKEEEGINVLFLSSQIILHLFLFIFTLISEASGDLVFVFLVINFLLVWIISFYLIIAGNLKYNNRLVWIIAMIVLPIITPYLFLTIINKQVKKD